MDRAGRRGRQAEAARNDLKVLQAAREVFAARGWEAPVSAIAERAGVGMGSLYRRYGSKTELLQYLCLLSMRQVIDAAENALAIDDPWNGLAAYIRACVDLGAGAFAPLAGSIEVTGEMLTTAKRSNELLRGILARAQRSGQARPDITSADIWGLIEHFSRRSANPHALDDPDTGARIFAIALDGLRPQSETCLRGTLQDPHAITRRWKSPVLAQGEDGVAADATVTQVDEGCGGVGPVGDAADLRV
jgi:AcrR family transcriptional regulator